MLEERCLRPNRALGQNFLIDHNLIQLLVKKSGAGAGDQVLEIGPGTGTLTDELLERGCRVVACELDRGLADLLEDRLAEPIKAGQLSLIRGDCLAGTRLMNPKVIAALGSEAFQLIANLPYGPSTGIIISLLTSHPSCSSMFITIQKEVADRLLAKPGDDAYGPLSALAQAGASITKLAKLSPECFWPRPKITSTMVSIVPEPSRGVDLGALSTLCRVVFANRRKQIGKALADLERAGELPGWWNPRARVDDLSISQLCELSILYDKHVSE